MGAPTTSPRPTPRPWNDYPGWSGGDDNDGGGGTSFKPPLTRADVLEGLGIEAGNAVGPTANILGSILESSDHPDIKIVGRALSGTGNLATAVTIAKKIDRAVTVEWDPDYPYVIGLAEIEVDPTLIAGGMISTGLSAMSAGVTSIVSYDGKPLDEVAAEYVTDTLDVVGAASGSYGAAMLRDYIETLRSNAMKQAQPVILDLDNDGIEFQSGFASTFDVDGDGYRERTAWANPDDGMLVIDLRSDGRFGPDGKIDQTKEVILSEWGPKGATDLQALAQAKDAKGRRIFDTNGDKRLDKKDARWDEFRVWRDEDMDGKSDRGELKTLDQLGITRIDLKYSNGKGWHDTSDDAEILGNTLSGTAAMRINGKLMANAVGDVSLAYVENGVSFKDTGLGFNLRWESGLFRRYLELDGSGSSNADFDRTWVDGLYKDSHGAYGDSRNNVLDGRDVEADLIVMGRQGNDKLMGWHGNDYIRGGNNDDTLHGYRGADNLGGGYGHDVILAGRGNDTLIGHHGDDRLYGRWGNDLIKGGKGDDILDGGEGDDVMNGGWGNDTFVFGSKWGWDEVLEFKSNDRLRFDASSSLRKMDDFDDIQWELSFSPDYQSRILDRGSLYVEGFQLSDRGNHVRVEIDGRLYAGEYQMFMPQGRAGGGVFSHNIEDYLDKYIDFG